MTSKWVVVQTKVNNEEKARENLIRQNFEVFYPRIFKYKKLYGKLNQTIKPLFPCYIFVNLKNDENWYKINNTFGVNKLIKFSNSIPSLPASFIVLLKSKCDKNNIYNLDKNFKKGDRVKVIKNSLYNAEAIFQEFIDSNRVIILLNILSSKVRTKICRNDIEILEY
tara:strand:- start:25 stop:525 length:501 start_codon:yes stop_codon:yes gene_type:complete